MEQIVHIEQGNPDESRELELTLAVVAALEKHYPNHYWRVYFSKGGVLVVRHNLINAVIALETGKQMSDAFGYLLPKAKSGTVHEAEQAAVKAAGMMLEAFKLPRGAWNGVDMPVMPEDLKRQMMGGKAFKGWK